MLSMSLQQAAAATGGQLLGADCRFSAVGIDSRTLNGGALFVALRGERFDGHDYLPQAQQAGAVAVMVERPPALDLPQLLVKDCRLALGRLAAAWRNGSTATLVAVTGSNGKTTLKEMLRAILLEVSPRVLSTLGNLNNDIGLPLTLLRLQDESLAVVEMGANHPGEIDYLSRIAQPDVAVLNNAGRAHLEGFGSLEGVARAKAEIINGLKDGGWFVYQADSPWAELWRGLSHGKRCLGFGLAETAEVRSSQDRAVTHWTEEGLESRFQVNTPRGSFDLALQLAGEHNRMNALAAVAVAHCLGIPADAIQHGLARVAPVKGRLECSRQDGVYLLDDSYNANPDSMAAAIEVLRSAPGRRILLLGDMAELGPGAQELHAETGGLAKAAGIEQLLATGPLSQATVERFGTGGRYFESRQQLIDAAKTMLRPGDAVLVKGSRSAAMDQVVAALRTPEVELCC